MARIYDLDSAGENVCKDLARSFQSAHLNFLLGSGASLPAIPVGGDIEREIEALLIGGQGAEARRRLYELLMTVQEPTNRLTVRAPSPEDQATLTFYEDLLRTIELILTERRTTILPRQATIFTTNYDLFIDAAARSCEAATVANGFDRGTPLSDPVEYSSHRFSLTTYDTGNLYEYRVELPSINLIKLHGCLSWQRDGERLTSRSAQCDPLQPHQLLDDAIVKQFVDRYAVVLPQATKFNATVLDRTYYELLRLYANALDKENVLLVCFGFSFRDEHVLHITRRALKNPTLRLVVVAYDAASGASFAHMFRAHSNVIVILSQALPVDFARFNQLISESVPRWAELA